MLNSGFSSYASGLTIEPEDFTVVSPSRGLIKNPCAPAGRCRCRNVAISLSPPCGRSVGFFLVREIPAAAAIFLTFRVLSAPRSFQCVDAIPVFRPPSPRRGGGFFPVIFVPLGLLYQATINALRVADQPLRDVTMQTWCSGKIPDGTTILCFTSRRVGHVITPLLKRFRRDLSQRCRCSGAAWHLSKRWHAPTTGLASLRSRSARRWHPC